MTHDAQAVFVPERGEHRVGLRVRGAVEHHQDLQIEEVLLQRAANRIGEVVVAVVGRDPQRDTREPSIEGHVPVIGTLVPIIERRRSGRAQPATCWYSDGRLGYPLEAQPEFCSAEICACGAWPAVCAIAWIPELAVP